jgi:hypothetical protein
MVCAAEDAPIAWLANVRELGLNRPEAVAAKAELLRKRLKPSTRRNTATRC